MRVLVVGPGVIGSVIAARLAAAGHDVTVFGRGARLERVRQDGLRLWNGPEQRSERIRVNTTLTLERCDHPYAVVAVRAHQWPALLPRLAATECREIVTLINHAGRLDPWRETLGDRLIPGFPGISGAFDGDVLTYALAPRAVQPTTLGESAGPSTPRIRRWRDHFEGAGLPVSTESNMEAWLRCHAGWMAAIMAATLACHGEPDVLVKDRVLRRDVVGAVRESLTALSREGVPLTPVGLATWLHIPTALLSGVLSLAARRPELAGRIRDAGSVRGEAEHIIAQLERLFADVALATPHWDALRRRL